MLDFSTLVRQRIGLLSPLRSIIISTNIDNSEIKVLQMVRVISKKFSAKSAYTTLGITILAVVALTTLFHPGSSASAQTSINTTCSANGSVSDGANGGVLFTVTTSGKCQEAPLQLVGVSSTGVKSVLSSKALSLQNNGTNVGSVNFVPTNTYSYYQVVIPNVFSANLQG